MVPACLLVFVYMFCTSCAYTRFYVPRWSHPTTHLKYCEHRVALASSRGRVAVVDTQTGDYVVDFTCPGHVGDLVLRSDALLVDYHTVSHHVSTVYRFSSKSMLQVTSPLPPRFSAFTSLDTCVTVYIDGSYVRWGTRDEPTRGCLSNSQPFLGYDVTDDFITTCYGTSELLVFDTLTGKVVDRVKLPSGVHAASVVVHSRTAKTSCGFITTPENELYRFEIRRAKGIQVTHLGVGQRVAPSSTRGTFLVTYHNYVGVIRGTNEIKWQRLPYANSYDVGGSTLVWSTGFNLFSTKHF